MPSMTSPLISIIVPVYKVEKSLADCVNSILGQSYPNLEVILVNDGSPDRCGAMCDEYAQHDSRVRVVHKANGGLADARNAGLDICKGDFIAFVDSDDIVHPQYIALLLEHIGAAEMIFCSYTTFTETSDIQSVFFDNDDVNHIKTFNRRGLMRQIMSFDYPSVVTAWNKLYRKTLWSDLRYPVGKIHEDEFVIHELIHRSEEIKYIDIPLYHYRQSEDGIMSTASSSKSLLDKLDAFGSRRLFFIEKGYVQGLKELNSEILYRCLMRTVSPENEVWQSIDTKTILFRNSHGLRAKVILLMKRFCFPWYRFILKNRTAG